MRDSDLQAFIVGYVAVIAIISIVSIAISLLVWWKIFSKAGFSGALSLLMTFIPLANIILLFYLAFAEWPIERELEAYRRGAMGGGGYPPSSGYPNQPPSGPGYPQY
ncbi:hypothetical protein [Ktedonospora formicarum]|uniref:Uncharacterized protein n=1 Tax=Ktedonospora formicarum TaxID=2778364 RepID=A0A8J3MTH3_9CHLR|nr:hypothetical protein [Ktedonospora formicarum]GHO44375.1 hypothetical protein KSX_25380 [Ktedonospora formicarum]